MIKARNVFLPVTGQGLAPSRLNRAFERLYKDIQESMEKRFNYFSFELDFSGIANTAAAAEFSYLIKPPFAWRVDSVEIYLYEPTGTVTEVSLTSTLPGFQEVSVAPAGATTRARAARSMSAKGVAGTEYSFTLAVTASGAYSLDRCRVVLHCRADRGDAGVTFNPIFAKDAPRFASGESVAAAKLNTAFTTTTTAVTQNTNASKGLRIMVFSLRSIPAALPNSDADIRVPRAGFNLHSFDVVNHGTATNNITGSVAHNSRTVTDVTVTVNGSGSPPTKTQGTAGFTQDSGSIYDSGDDYFVRIQRAGPDTIPLAYVVCYFQ